jgi:pimeloyl-ACP methyl ester carboxylesterase
MLHGQPGSARDWRPVELALAGRLRTLAIDRPGYDGRTPAGGLAHSGAAALRALDARGEGRAVIAGPRYGAAVAAWLAVHNPERVAGLFLIAPAANTAALVPLDRLLAAPLLGPAAYVTTATAARAALSLGRLRSRLARTLTVPDEVLAGAGARLRARDTWRAFVVEQRAMFAELPDLESRLRDIDAPTTVVVGTADHLVPPDAARRLAGQIPAARLIELPGAGHILPLQQPARLAELLIEAVAAPAR